MIKVHKNIGEKLLYIREKKHLTQVKFGEILGIKQNTYSELESGKRMPSLENVMLYAERLGVSWKRFVEDDKNDA